MNDPLTWYQRRVLTIGYSRQTPATLLVALRGITRVIDVRSRANSRRPEFCKPALCQWLEEAGIRYEHWPMLGGLDATPAQQTAAVDALIDQLTGNFERTCLLCLERDPEDCHRSYLLEPLFRRRAFALAHLVPPLPKKGDTPC